MSTDATSPNSSEQTHAVPTIDASTTGKGKSKLVQDDVMDDEDEDDEEEEEDEDDEMEEETFEEIDPSAIISAGRRTRGVRVDYTSAEALQKAGLKPDAADEDENEDSFVAQDDEMKDD